MSESGLLDTLGDVEQLAPRRWLLRADADHAFTCSVDDEWILLDQPTALSAAEPLSLIEPNAALPPLLKLAVMSDDSVHVRAEVPADGDGDAGEQLGAVVAQVFGRRVDVGGGGTSRETPLDTPVLSPVEGPPKNGGYSGRTESRRVEATLDPFAPSRPLPSGRIEGRSEHTADLATLCTEAGWPGVERPDGRVAVELEVHGSFQQALVERGDGQTRAVVDFGAREPAQTASGNAAIAALLFRVAGLVRMVRVGGDGATPCLEVALGASPTPAAVGHALSALSIAGRLCAREVDVLRQDETLAAAYLESLRKKPAYAV